MKQKKQQYDDLNCTEQKARELFEYDEDSLLAEMDEAERAWEAEKAANPEAAAQVLRDADEGFAKLMAHIKAKGIQPVSEEEYEKEYQRERQKNIRTSVRLGRGRRKVLLLAAAVCVLGLGTTMVVSAHREYKYNLYPVEAEQNVLVKQNSVMRMDAKKIEEAYIEIEDRLGIKSLKLGYTLADMRFKQGIISKDHAIIELEYKGMSVYLKESNNPLSDDVLQVKASDRETCEEVDNKWLKKKIEIEENILQEGLVEYSTYLSTDSSYYYLSGMMEKDDFIKLVQGLYY